MGRWVEDDEDIHVGNYSEIGESLQGMQHTNVGAAAALRQLRGQLGSLAANRFGQHAPVSKQMRSPYKDSTQIGISATGTFTLTSWSSSVLPQISGLTRVYKSFKPTKAILTELVTVTFNTTTLGTATRVASVSDAADLVLVQAFSGADNCFPNAPTEANGISGPTFANNSLGNGISWPTINGGIDMTVAFAIEQSVVFQVAPPAGYTTDDITSISVKLRFNLLGPSLR
jgi:hypothetical protein